jgi:hypothetical protein
LVQYRVLRASTTGFSSAGIGLWGSRAVPPLF